MTGEELVGIALRMQELGQEDPMGEDELTEFLDLGFTLSSWVGSDAVCIEIESEAGRLR